MIFISDIYNQPEKANSTFINVYVWHSVVYLISIVYLHGAEIWVNTSCYKLFCITEKLTARNKSSLLSTTLCADSLPGQFTIFKFLKFKKVKTIRDQLNSSLLPRASLTAIKKKDTEIQQLPFIIFQPIPVEFLCELDPVPTSQHLCWLSVQIYTLCSDKHHK